MAPLGRCASPRACDGAGAPRACLCLAWMTDMSGLLAAAARKRHACLLLHNGEAQMKLLQLRMHR